MKPLRPKQELFCNEYIKDLNATQAAIRAGYSKKTSYSIGNELLNKPEIKAYIEQKREIIAKRNEISIDWIIKELKDTYNACRKVEPVVDFKGNETGEYKFEAASAVRSLELLGKHLGMFTEKLKVEGGDKPIQVDVKMSAESIVNNLENILIASKEPKED